MNYNIITKIKESIKEYELNNYEDGREEIDYNTLKERYSKNGFLFRIIMFTICSISLLTHINKSLNLIEKYGNINVAVDIAHTNMVFQLQALIPIMIIMILVPSGLMGGILYALYINADWDGGESDEL